MNKPITIIQRFQRAPVAGRFRVLGKMQVVRDGKILADTSAAAIVVVVEHGIAQHSHVAPLWPTWK